MSACVQHRRRRPRMLAVLAVTSALALGYLPAARASAPDLFVDRFGDAMDFANADDVAITPNTTSGMANASIGGGQFHADIAGAGWIALLWPGFPGALPHGREGNAQPADANRYGRLVARLNVTVAQPMVVLWHTCAAADASCQGGTAVSLTPGWQTYDVALQANAGDAGLRAPWAGAIHGLRLLFPAGSGHVDVDWVRVAPSDGSTVGELGDRSSVVFDDALDYATRAGDAWDFDQPGDALSVDGVSRSSVTNGVLSACNAAVNASTGDPNVVLRLPAGPIDANRFHRLAVTLRYEGAFSLNPGAGGGSLMRVVWKDGAGRRHVSQDIVTYPNEPVIVADLRTNPPSAVSEDGASWSGPVTALRIDPNEDAGARCWTIDHVRLLADPGTDLGAIGTPLPAATSAATRSVPPTKPARSRKPRTTRAPVRTKKR